jgi:hypothetical protein
MECARDQHVGLGVGDFSVAIPAVILVTAKATTMCLD